jgi:protease-4
MYDDYENRTADQGQPPQDARPGAWDRPAAAAPYGAQNARRAGGRWKKGVLICLAVFFGILLLGLAFRAASDIDGAQGRPYIAQFNVIGTISGAPSADLFGNLSGYYHDWTLARIDDCLYDDENKGLILFVDSPGGGVYESDALYRKLCEYRDATGRPVYAVMGSMAASGGYYISAAAERIYADRNTWTGSIGVTMGVMVDLSGFLERYGVKTETITAGRNKAMGSDFEPMTDEQRAIFQGLVDEAYDQFTGIVAEERALDPDYVRELADGRIYTAAQARENGLVDDLGDLETALKHMQDAYGLSDCEPVEFNYTSDSLLGKLLGAEAEKGLSVLLTRLSAALSQGEGDIGAVLKLAESRVPAPQYLYER